MEASIFGAALAFCAGAAIASVNYIFSRYILKNHSSKYAATQILRQLIQVAFLVCVFVFGEYTPWDRIWLLIGGCLGVTLPMLWFTYRLVRLNDSLSRKEDSSDG